MLTLAATLVACVLIATAFRAAEIQLESVEAAGPAVPSSPAVTQATPPRAVPQSVASASPSMPAAPFTKTVAGVDTDFFYPPGMLKPFDRDFTDTTLEDFLSELARITGYIVRPEIQTLTDAGVTMDSTLSAQTKGAPAYLALRRALENVNGVKLTWYIFDGILFITTDEAEKDKLVTDSIDVSVLLDAGCGFNRLTRLAYEMIDTQWLVEDGEGGELTPVLKSLFIRNTSQAILQTRRLYNGLLSKAYKTLPFASLQDRAVEAALQKTISPHFVRVTLENAIASLSEELGFTIDFDVQSLTDAGVPLDSEITLWVDSISFRTALNLLLENVNGVRLDAFPQDGRLLITTYEHSHDSMTVTIYRLPRLSAVFDSRSLIRLIKDQTSEEILWTEDDGEGGEIDSPLENVIVIRQTKRGSEEIEDVLDRVLKSAAEHPFTDADLNVVAVRRYPMLTSKAHDLARSIPRFVAINQWGRLPDGTEALIETVTLTGTVHNKLKADGKVGAFSTVDQVTEGESALVIRQTRGVHDEIQKFIRDLEPYRSSSGSLPTSY
jgi:hypothetical protein